MPDSRHRRTLRTPSALRLLPRPRPRPPRSASTIPTPPTPQTSPDSPNTAPHRLPTPHDHDKSHDIRVRSLGTDTSETHVVEKERDCNSLPPTTTLTPPTTHRERRNGCRFDTFDVDPCQPQEQAHQAEDDPQVLVRSTDHDQWEEDKHASMDHVVAELVEIRDVYREQQDAIERLIVAMERQSARMERQMDEWRVREGTGRREPRAVEVLVFGVLDVLAMVVLCLVTWCVGKPLGWGRRALRWVLGHSAAEGKRRCSWRMSWRGAAVSDDPFLASAAQRLSFSTAADLRD